jgi:hypothetical protein
MSPKLFSVNTRPVSLLPKMLKLTRSTMKNNLRYWQ